jgi:cysteine desulfurase/selenocysteine lyase
LQQVDDLLRARTPPRLVVLPHASNVTGAVLPVREIADLAHAYGALVLLDVAQTAGHFPVDLTSLDVDMAAFTGHKGLLGPQGTGGLWVREGVSVRPLAYGGTGGDSQPPTMPDSYPDHLEAGTQNSPGIAGLAAGVQWILDRGIGELHGREALLKKRLLDRIAKIPELRVVSTSGSEGVGIVTMVHDRLPSSELAAAVERSHGVQGRAGLHCAPEAHEVLRTSRYGAFRLSVGWATSESDIDIAAAALQSVGG